MRVPVALKDRLAALARSTGRSMSLLGQAALEEYLDRESWQIARIQEGIAAADAGALAGEDEVEAVLDRWAE